VLSLGLDDGKLEDASTGVDQGAGMRVEIGDRTNFANANVADVDDVIALAGRLAAGVTDAQVGTEVAAPRPEKPVSITHEVLVDPRSVEMGRKVALLRHANDVARAADTRVRQVTIRYGETVQDVVVANSDGRHRTDTRVRLVFTVQVTARDGDVLETGYEALGGTIGFEMLTAEAVAAVAETAARRALLNVSAQPAPAGTYTVVLSSEAGGTLIHESVGHGLEADLNLKGVSVYSGKIGTRVAGPLITVVDDGTDPGRRGTARIDDEGARTNRTILIAQGVLLGYLSDRKHARKLGIAESGNGRRESFRQLPVCRMTNTMIAPGTSDPEAILASVDDGIFVRKMGGGQVDVVSGNFAFEITECHRIRGGRIAEPLRGATLVGEGPSLMREIDMVGWDLGYSVGTCGKDGQSAPISGAQPTLRIPSIVVGGKVGA